MCPFCPSLGHSDVTKGQILNIPQKSPQQFVRYKFPRFQLLSANIICGNYLWLGAITVTNLSILLACQMYIQTHRPVYLHFGLWSCLHAKCTYRHTVRNIFILGDDPACMLDVHTDTPSDISSYWVMILLAC